MIRQIAYFLLALLAEVLAWLAFAVGFIRGAMVAAYERGFTRGYESAPATPVAVHDDEDDE